MTTTTFDQVQRLINQLTPLEQVRLLAYLTPRIVRTFAVIQPPATANGMSLPEAWQTFFQLGDELSQGDQLEKPTLTQTVQTMRR